jgi:hypothetical protein
MIKSVYIPYVWKLSPEAAFAARAHGDMTRLGHNLREQTQAAESELNALLADGYSVIAVQALDTSREAGLIVVLHKVDEVTDDDIEFPF